MAAAFPLIGYRAQPQITARANPVWGGLILLANPVNGVARINAVTGDAWTNNGSIGLTQTLAGKALSLNGSSQYASQAKSILGNLTETSQLTVVTVFTTTDATNRGTIFGLGRSSDPTPFVLCGVNNTAGKLELSIRTDAGLIDILASSNSFLTSGVNVAIYREIGPSSRDVMLNGVVSSSSGSIGATHTLTLDQTAIGCLWRTTTGIFFNGQVALVAVLNRAITDSERAALRDNPWQLFAPQTRRIPINAAAAGNTTITPSAGSLVLSGSAPAQTIGVLPAGGSLSLAGYQPSLLVGQTIQPGAGSLVLSGSQPVVSLGFTRTPSAGALVLSGFQPSLGLTIAPGTGLLALSGSQLGISQGTVSTPQAGSLNLSGSQPAQNITVVPAAGALIISGSQPGVTNSGQSSFTITPSTGLLSFSGSAPNQGIGVTPGAGPLALTGGGSSLDLGNTPSAGSLTLVGSQPGVRSDFVITPAAGQLTLVGSQPSIQAPLDVVITPGAGSLLAQGNQPQVNNSTVVFLDTHDGFRKKKRKDTAEQEAAQFKERQQTRRKAIEEAVSPPEQPEEAQKEPGIPVQASEPPKLAPLAAKVAIIQPAADEIEAEDQAVILSFLRQLEADELEMAQGIVERLLKRA